MKVHGCEVFHYTWGTHHSETTIHTITILYDRETKKTIYGGITKCIENTDTCGKVLNEFNLTYAQIT